MGFRLAGLPGTKKKVQTDSKTDRHKSGRPSKLPLEIAVKIKRKLKGSKQEGWTTTKQVNEMIVKDGRVRYHHIYIYTLLHKWGFKQKVPRKVHVNTASEEEKEGFKKERRKYQTTLLMGSQQYHWMNPFSFTAPL